MTKVSSSRARDERWYVLWKTGTTQKEIAEGADVSQAYVSSRIKKHKERVGSSKVDTEPARHDLRVVKEIFSMDNEHVLKRLETALEARSDDIDPSIFLFENMSCLSARHQSLFTQEQQMRIADITYGFSRWIDEKYRPFYKRCQCQNPQ